MRHLLRPVTFAGWAFAALVLLFVALVAPGRASALAMLGSLAGAGLSFLVWRHPRPAWGAVAYGALVLAPLLFALWWGNPFVLLLALPPIVLLAVEPGLRAPALPAARSQAALVLVFAYLLLAPAVDALAFAASAPPRLDHDIAAAVGTEERRSLGGGAGALWSAKAYPQDSPPVGLVRATYPEGADLAAALRASYAPGQEQALPFLPFPVWVAEQRRADVVDLGAGWQRISVVDTTTTLFLLLPIPMEDGVRQVFLLKPVDRATRLSLLPPFFEAQTVYGGFHLADPGDNAATLRLLSTNVSVQDERLALPARAYEDLDVGEFHRTPGLEVTAILAALGFAALRKR